MQANYWYPIRMARTDGTTICLWYPKNTLPESIQQSVDVGLVIDGWYFSSPKQIDDGWVTAFGSIGEPTHFMKIVVP